MNVGGVIRIQRAAGAVCTRVHVCAAAMVKARVVCGAVWVKFTGGRVRAAMRVVLCFVLGVVFNKIIVSDTPFVFMDQEREKDSVRVALVPSQSTRAQPV